MKKVTPVIFCATSLLLAGGLLMWLMSEWNKQEAQFLAQGQEAKFLNQQLGINIYVGYESECEGFRGENSVEFYPLNFSKILQNDHGLFFSIIRGRALFFCSEKSKNEFGKDLAGYSEDISAYLLHRSVNLYATLEKETLSERLGMAYKRAKWVGGVIRYCLNGSVINEECITKSRLTSEGGEDILENFLELRQGRGSFYLPYYYHRLFSLSAIDGDFDSALNDVVARNLRENGFFVRDLAQGKSSNNARGKLSAVNNMKDGRVILDAYISVFEYASLNNLSIEPSLFSYVEETYKRVSNEEKHELINSLERWAKGPPPYREFVLSQVCLDEFHVEQQVLGWVEWNRLAMKGEVDLSKGASMLRELSLCNEQLNPGFYFRSILIGEVVDSMVQELSVAFIENNAQSVDNLLEFIFNYTDVGYPIDGHEIVGLCYSDMLQRLYYENIDGRAILAALHDRFTHWEQNNEIDSNCLLRNELAFEPIINPFDH